MAGFGEIFSSPLSDCEDEPAARASVGTVAEAGFPETSDGFWLTNVEVDWESGVLSRVIFKEYWNILLDCHHQQFI